MPTKLPRSQLIALAQRGAEARLRDLQREIASLYRSFPGLKRARTAASAEVAPGERQRRKPVWSAAKRKAAADRMRKYWAGRRAEQKSATAKRRA